MAFEVSAKTSTRQPIALRRSRWGVIAASSSCGGRRRSSAEYQPETRSRPKRPSTALRALAFRGNLCPSSMPSKPASLASARQTSSGVAPPSERKSSFDHPIGFAPMRTLISSPLRGGGAWAKAEPGGGRKVRARRWGQVCKHVYQRAFAVTRQPYGRDSHSYPSPQGGGDWRHSAKSCTACPLHRGLILGPCPSHLGAFRDLGHGDLPPVAAGRGREARVGVDHDGGRALGGAGPAERRLELGEARRLLGRGAEAAGMGHEIDRGQGLVAGALEEVVEALSPS